MEKIKLPKVVTFEFNIALFKHLGSKAHKFLLPSVVVLLVVVSIFAFKFYLSNGLGLAYNDARSHLNIGRRVVEGLKPGLAQIGSVWLPLPHLLMVPTIWNDFMWHSGLAGAIQSMFSFVLIGALIWMYLKELHVSLLGRIFGVVVFVFNINILYLQSTAMTELLLLATMTLSAYELLMWHKTETSLHLIKAAFWVMISTVTRYDGWFLLFASSMFILLRYARKKDYRTAEGTFILFCTLAGLGVGLWLLWNLLVFKDPLFFALGPFSAKAQQDQIDQAGLLITKHNWYQSFKFYFYAMTYNSGFLNVVLGFLGMLAVLKDKLLSKDVKSSVMLLLAPLFFNVLALYLGHSVLFIQGLSGDTWFNVRYGIMLMPTIAIFSGFLIDRAKRFRLPLIFLYLMFTFFNFYGGDAVTIDDALVGSSQKNVSEVSGWLKDHATDKKGFILMSAASHDAIIFSSGLPMKRFIHEGTGLYWLNALSYPDKWARWIVMRTNDTNDLAFRGVSKSEGFAKYNLVGQYPFADIYELKDEYLFELNTDPVIGKQK